jgi:hypothetical protein
MLLTFSRKAFALGRSSTVGDGFRTLARQLGQLVYG